MKFMLKAALAAAVVSAVPMASVHAEDTKLAVNVFQGMPNLPLWAAQAKGYFAKRGLAVDITYTPNSDAQRQGLAEGRYQIIHTALDNAFALKDTAKVDIAVVLGGDNGFNHLVVQADIQSLADLKGKTVVVDSPNTAFAFLLYEMLRQKGVNKGDYEVKAAGATNLRFEAMLKDKTLAAAIMGPPFSIRATQAGLKDMGRATDVIGAYQSQSAVVLRAWAKDNADTLVKYLQAYIEGWRWAFDPNNRKEVIALLVDRLKSPEDAVTAAFDETKGDFNREGAMDMEGVKNALKLRATYGGGTPAAPESYIDMSYYQKAVNGLR